MAQENGRETGGGPPAAEAEQQYSHSNTNHLPPEDDFLAWLELYWKLDFDVIPLDMKESLCRWKRKPPRTEVRRLLGSGRATGMAVVLGPRSNGLVCRDFDQVAAYQSWCDSRGDDETELPFSAPTAQTPRPGRHVFGISKGTCPLIRFADGELRGQGGYVVLPPSLHPSGAHYRWLRDPFSNELPVVSPDMLVLPAQKDDLDRKQSHVRSQSGSQVKTPKTPNNELCQMGSAVSIIAGVTNARDFIEWTTRETQPRGHGQRNCCIFDLARHLRRVFPIEAIETDEPELFRIVRRWFDLALPAIRTTDFSVTWADFLRAWGNVKFVTSGFHACVQALARCDTFVVGNRKTYQDLVARVFRSASAVVGGTAFFLDYRQLGAIAGVDRQTAYNQARSLQELGLLACLDPGLKGIRHRKATTWRWDGPELPASPGNSSGSAGCR